MLGLLHTTVSHTLNNFLSFRPPPPFSVAVGKSLSNFLDRLNQYMLMQGIDGNGHNDDRFQQAYLENSLTGTALASYKELKKKPNVQDFSRLVGELKKLYPECRDADLYQQLIYDRKQRHTESVIEFYNDLKTLSPAAYPELDDKAKESILKTMFLRGVLPEVKQALKFRTAQYTESQFTKGYLYDAEKIAVIIN